MLSPSNYETIQIERRENGVVLATLNRPDRLNAIDRRMHYELAQITRDAGADRELNVLVITGAGRSFCAGGDFAGGFKQKAPEGSSPLMVEAIQIVENLLDCPKPVICAVNGYAMGLGANFALLCDIVVGGPGTVFADTHVNLAIGAGDGGQLIWPLLLGVNRAKYYLMTGDRLEGAEAERLGLVNFLVDDDQILAKALKVADRLGKGPALAIQASKIPINRWIKLQAQQIMPLSIELEKATMRSEDAVEAGKAFAEKREPDFQGR
jgi:enoyl-CoA hydratase